MMMLIVAAIICTALAATPGVRADVAMVYSIQRHGARNQLPKTSLLKESASLAGPTLLPLGERLCYNAGLDFRARYVDPAACGSTGTCIRLQTGSQADGSYGLLNAGKPFNNYNTLVRSSYTDRAVLSALSFFSGIFPANSSEATATEYLPTGAQLVPMYTQPDQDDYLIRAYTKCPTYDKALTNWYQSPEFKAKEQESQSLRDSVKQVVPTLDTSLPAWWNAYDGFNTWRSYGVGDPQPLLDNVTWTATQQLAYWLETAKSKSTLAKNLLGGPLVADMLAYMKQALTAVQASLPEYYKLLSISSHYNVQLAVTAALALDQYAPAVAALPWLNATLPQLASVVVFELHVPASGGANTTADTAAVRLVVQQGPGKAYGVVPLPCAAAGDAAQLLAGAGACTLTNFLNLATPASLPTAAAWCSACNNTQAAACQALGAQATQGTGASAGDDSDTVSQSKFNTAVILSTVLTFFGTLVLCAAVFGYMYMRLRRRQDPYLGQATTQKSGALDEPMAL